MSTRFPLSCTYFMNRIIPCVPRKANAKEPRTAMGASGTKFSVPRALFALTILLWNFCLWLVFFLCAAHVVVVLVHSVFKEPVNTVHFSKIRLRNTQACLQHCESSILLSNFVCVTSGCSSSLCVFIRWGHRAIPFFNTVSNCLCIHNFNFLSAMQSWANFFV